MRTSKESIYRNQTSQKINGVHIKEKYIKELSQTKINGVHIKGTLYKK